jgi:hypothetical protein
MSGKQRQRVERARRARRRRRLARRGAGRPSILQALTTSTLALPGIAGSAAADTPTEQVTAEYSFARYSEDELSDWNVATGGETSRYEIDIHQLRLAAPITNRIDVALDVAYETMTGATPWYVNPPALGVGETHPRVVMTGASVSDERTDILARGTYYLDEGNAVLSTGVSTENDYLAFNAGIEGTRHLNEKNTSFSGGLGFSIDQIEPTDGGTEDRPTSEDKQSVSLFGGFSQVLSKRSTLQSSLSYQFSNGFLSDPYKAAIVAGARRPDTRPDQRHQLAWLTRYRRHVEGIGASIHFDYTLYLDDWGVNAHTFDLAWYQNFFGIARLIPSVRYYSQSQADFYAPWFNLVPGDGLFSSDYRLSPYGALAYRVRAEARFQTWQLDWILNVGYERYESEGDLALGSVDLEHPALVSFDLFSAGFDLRF